MIRRRRAGPRARWIAAGAALILASGVATVLATGPHNFREVDPGRLYRSGQLSGDEFRQVIDQYGIKTIINLRGATPRSDWYREEVAAVREKGVRLIDIAFSSGRIPHPRRLIVLLDAYRDAERPILVHCQSGADRAGEASAIYQIEYMGKSKEEALEMLTLRHLHLGWRRPAMRYFIGRYQGEEWVRNAYDPCEPDYEYYDKEKYCR
jgi:protein tyrosine/serine phosphatase